MGTDKAAYSPRQIEIRSDDGHLARYKIEDLDPDDAFDLLLDLVPAMGPLIAGLSGLKSIASDGPLMGLVSPWVSQAGDEEEDGRPKLSLDDSILPYLHALGEIGSPEMAAMPAEFAAVIKRAGGSRLIRVLLSCCHRYDTETREGGWVRDEDNYTRFYKGNIGEALRAAWHSFRYNFGKMLKLGK
jgi:hypothetical protein